MRLSRNLLAYCLAIAVGLSSPIAASAQESDQGPELCLTQQFILSRVGHSNGRLNLILKMLRRLSAAPLTVPEMSTSAIRLQEHRGTGDGGNAVPCEDIRQNRCELLRKHRRSAIREAQATGERASLSALRLAAQDCSLNGLVNSTHTPNDYYYVRDYLWGLNQGNDIDIDAPEAWDKSKGSDGIVVAVIDTGIDWNHPDLVANMWTNDDEIPNNGVDDDSNGYVDDYYGWNSYQDNGNAMDDQGHGTHCAGTVGAVGDNSIGVVGVNQKVQLMAVKFMYPYGNGARGSTYDAVQAIDYVGDLKEDGEKIFVTSNSWGGGGYYSLMEKAIRRHNNLDIHFVAAAGNCSCNNDSTPHYPSSYSNSNVVAVAALDANGMLASYSNYGVSSVDIAAPGSEILSTYPGNRYGYMWGTSMATPHVAGALALLKAYAFNLTQDQMTESLYDNAVSLGSLSGRIKTGKLLNVNNMLANAPENPAPPKGYQPYPTPTATPTPSPSPTPTATPTYPPAQHDISGSVLNGDVGVPGAQINIVTDQGEEFARVSGPNGEFEFTDVWGPATYTLRVTKPGMNFNPVVGFLVGDVYHDVMARVGESTLSALVLSPLANPVAGVTIDAGELGSAVSNSSGRVSFSAEYGVEYTVRALSTTYVFDEPTHTGTILGDVDRVFVARRIE